MTGVVGMVAVISGPSGVGKTTVIEGLLRSPGWNRSITATTRAPRGAEKDGVDYLFLTKEGFEADAKKGRFLEHAKVHGNLYGTPRDGVEAVLARGEICVLNIDVQGAESLRRSGLKVATIFLLPPSMEELERRLSLRATEAPDTVRLRLEVARAEMAEAHRFDLGVVNRDVMATVEEIRRWIDTRRMHP